MAKSLIHARLSALEERYRSKIAANSNKRLRVFYGWTKVNKIRRKEAISVIFENDSQREDRTLRFVNRMQTTVYVREQTDREKIGVDDAIRMYTEYSIYLSDKSVQGSLELALNYNSESDKYNVPEDERHLIASKLRESYLETHPDYREPIIQLQLNF